MKKNISTLKIKGKVESQMFLLQIIFLQHFLQLWWIEELLLFLTLQKEDNYSYFLGIFGKI